MLVEERPPLFAIRSRDWWVKVTGMLQHNWALIEAQESGEAMAYFFHDDGGHLSSKYKTWQLRDRSPIIDSITFRSHEEAVEGLGRNGFDRLDVYPGPWDGCEPKGNFYDARDEGRNIYSSGEYWI
jgi:hypothetical protein